MNFILIKINFNLGLSINFTLHLVHSITVPRENELNSSTTYLFILYLTLFLFCGLDHEFIGNFN